MPFRRFLAIKASGGILLIIATLAAMIAANSPFADSYEQLWETKFGFSFGGVGLFKPLILWVNDGLMALFFFVIGLEIKREILEGELSSPRQAALPIAAAIGGMVVPAAIYLAFNLGTPTKAGWGIPMATDIAFALGILMLLGDRVPAALKTFLAALAIVDDLGAVLVIALFYTSDISLENLGLGAGFLALLVAANMLGIRHVMVYAVLGVGGLWLAFLLSGVHPTVAGVLAAFCIPARSRIDCPAFVASSRAAVDEFEAAGTDGENVLTNAGRQSALLKLELLSEAASPPLQRLEHNLHPWVMYLIMPIFAFANAGVRLDGELSGLLSSAPVLGIVLGLFIGKQIGVFGFSWLAVKLNLAVLPSGTCWSSLYGTSLLAGIGFTMSLFIASLAFSTQPEVLAQAKLAILIASTISAVLGFAVLLKLQRKE